MRKSRYLGGLLALGALLTGCAGAPPAENHEYLLRPQGSEVASGVGTPVRLKAVIIPPYLDQRGLVLQTGDAEIQAARHHRWAEPLDEAAGRYLQVGIARQSGRPVEIAPLAGESSRAVITVRIHQFHGTETGRVRLVADWSVTPAAGEPIIHTFDDAVSQAADGYPSLVTAHAVLLDELAAAIARSLDD